MHHDYLRCAAKKKKARELLPFSFLFFCPLLIIKLNFDRPTHVLALSPQKSIHGGCDGPPALQARAVNHANSHAPGIVYILKDSFVISIQIT